MEAVSGPPVEIISYNPATGEELGRVPLTDTEAVRTAVQKARETQVSWAKASFRERAAVVLRARQFVLDEIEQIAQLISRETGKPAAEAIAMEIVPALDLMDHFSHKTARLLRPQKIDIGLYKLMGRSSRLVFKPFGVIGIISPWNFPWATPLDEVVLALMAGNAVVLKPSELTPFTALKIGEMFKRAGLPDSLLAIVTGDGSTGAALVDAGVDKIIFTGSVATGKRVAEGAAKHLTPCVLELGGKDPMIVLDDANLLNAARGAVWAAFANSGQACASVERCYVQESVFDRFVELVKKEVSALHQSAGQISQPDIGAMTNERQLKIVEEHIVDALKRGARIMAGGHRLKTERGWFHEPTVLTDVDHSMTVMHDETFGPVLPIMTFTTEDEAIQLANDSIYGLTASVWTSSYRRGRRIAHQIEAGTVMVNEVLYTHAIAQTPWGGVKQSGYGRTHGRLGLLEMVSPTHVHVNRLPWIPDIWWFSYSESANRLFRALARRFTTNSVLRAGPLVPQILRRWREHRRR
ncbi:MAG: aldehyde dehydrogenase family protein [Pyrinomonadaceae bacterium]